MTLINFLINNPCGTIFSKTVNAPGCVKYANLLFELVDGLIEEIGEELIVQVISSPISLTYI